MNTHVLSMNQATRLKGKRGISVLLVVMALVAGARLEAADQKPPPDTKPFVYFDPQGDSPRNPVWVKPDHLPMRPIQFQVSNAEELAGALKACQMVVDGKTIAAVVKLNDEVDWGKLYASAGNGQKQSVTLFVPDNSSAWKKFSSGNAISLDYSPEQRLGIPQANARLKFQWDIAQDKAQQVSDPTIKSELQASLRAASALRAAYDRLAESATNSDTMLDADAPAYLLSGMNALTTVIGEIAAGKAKLTNEQLRTIERQSQLIGGMKAFPIAEFLQRKEMRRVRIHVITKEVGTVIPDLEVMACNQMSYELKDRSSAFSFDRQTSPATRTLPPFSYCIWAIDPRTKQELSQAKILDVQQAQVNEQGVFEVDLEVVRPQPVKNP